MHHKEEVSDMVWAAMQHPATDLTNKQEAHGLVRRPSFRRQLALLATPLSSLQEVKEVTGF